MFDWKKDNLNPGCEYSRENWRNYYDNTITKWCLYSKFSRDQEIINLIELGRAGKKILDVGFGEHTIDCVKSPDWFHRKLRSNQNNIVFGGDINEDLVKKIRLETGYDNLIIMDATDKKLIVEGGGFDVIHAGDLIEHLSNPGDFFVFCKNNLKSGGRVIITTPNPHCISYLSYALKFGGAIANFEHTCWITPVNFNELCRRGDFEFEESHYSVSSKLYSFIFYVLQPFFFRIRDLLFSEYVYVCRKK